ncbi:hypothetical protein PIB30_063364 [Stylosanthes scabra]|uniref:Uncharacterized protein n=1 Tax=Stylosanthes scabra TaxID=79078 RepID=A0ABU6SLR6_9FABA|nr:hypothetical protein [Stylosanthes scabra]
MGSYRNLALAPQHYRGEEKLRVATVATIHAFFPCSVVACLLFICVSAVLRVSCPCPGETLNQQRIATPTSQRLKSATKKKFGYNNGKCLHGLNGVMLEFGTQWNFGRLFLRCPFSEVDEIEDAEKSTLVQERVEEIHNKAE